MLQIADPAARHQAVVEQLLKSLDLRPNGDLVFTQHPMAPPPIPAGVALARDALAAGSFVVGVFYGVLCFSYLVVWASVGGLLGLLWAPSICAIGPQYVCRLWSDCGTRTGKTVAQYSAELDAEVATASPPLLAARAALMHFTKTEVLVLKTLKHAAAGIELLGKALCILFGIRPLGWEAALQHLFQDASLGVQRLHAVPCRWLDLAGWACVGEVDFLLFSSVACGGCFPVVFSLAV